MYLHKTDHKYSDTHRHMTGAKKAAADFVTVPLQPFPTEKNVSPAFQILKIKSTDASQYNPVPAATLPKERKEEHGSRVITGQQSPLHFAPLFFAKD